MTNDTTIPSATSTSNSTFVLRNHAPPARAETIEALFAYAKVNWKLEVPSWPQEQANQPSGKLPVLVESNTSGTKFVLSETLAIESYLAKKFNLTVSDSPEMVARQVELRTQINDIYELALMHKIGSTEERKVVMEKFVGAARAIVRYHEKVLQANGSNGHYFGDRVTYMDIVVFAFFCILNSQIAADMPQALDFFSEHSAPLLNKVYTTTAKEPALADFVSSFRK
ncbi:hypothetical protein LPJ73_003021 [Coemansia sp. RSA 2703]|nr:hypothetical protein LPJ73_003021 [Coemansia sp. RSA 2703]